MPKKRTRKHWFLRGFGCGVLFLPLLAIALGFYMHCEAESLTVNHVDLESDSWTLPPVVVAVAADFHVGSSAKEFDRLRKAVDMIAAEKPDLILLPGDFVAGVRPSQAAPPLAIARELAKLKAPLGVYAMLGNHDHWQGTEHFVNAFAKAGVPLLENRTVDLQFRGKRFHLVGVTDDWTKTPEMWTRLLPKDSLPRIVMTHSPDVYATLPEPVALAVAGHTHGGQVVLPLLGPLFVPSRFGRRYLSGVVKEGRNTIFITRGVGTSFFAVRLFCPPEIAALRLHGKRPAVPEPVVPDKR